MMKVCMVCGKDSEHKSWKSYTCNACLTAGLKYCPACDNTQDITNFHKNGHTLRSLCKSCEIERSKQNKADIGYYDRPEVKAKRNEDSRKCKRTQYNNNEEYRIAEIIRCHERREKVSSRTITTAEWLETVEAFGNACAYCGSKHNLSMDHIIPISKGGLTTIDNIIPACGSCNSSKQARDLVEWYTSQPYYSEKRLEAIIKFVRTRR